MTRDPIDDLLDASASPTARRDPELEALLNRMADDARAVVQGEPGTRRRRRNVGIAAALAGVLVVGGGGIAVASGLVPWPSGYETPDNAFSFALPSGRPCEVRLVVGSRIEGAEQSATTDGTALSQEAQRARDLTGRWLHETDLLSTLDLAASQAEVEGILANQRLSGMTVLIGDRGWLTDANIASHREADADDRYAFAVDRALRSALQQRLEAAGISEGGSSFALAGGVKCAAE